MNITHLECQNSQYADGSGSSHVDVVGKNQQKWDPGH